MNKYLVAILKKRIYKIYKFKCISNKHSKISRESKIYSHFTCEDFWLTVHKAFIFYETNAPIVYPIRLGWYHPILYIIFFFIFIS